MATYRDNFERAQIVVMAAEIAFDPDEPLQTVWSWKRLIVGGDHDGVQIDGSGALRNSVKDLDKLLKKLKKDFPDDEIVGVPNG